MHSFLTVATEFVLDVDVLPSILWFPSNVLDSAEASSSKSPSQLIHLRFRARYLQYCIICTFNYLLYIHPSVMNVQYSKLEYYLSPLKIGAVAPELAVRGEWRPIFPSHQTRVTKFVNSRTTVLSWYRTAIEWKNRLKGTWTQNGRPTLFVCRAITIE